jgi:TRAP transporter TAXI family solute receptor
LVGSVTILGLTVSQQTDPYQVISSDREGPIMKLPIILCLFLTLFAFSGALAQPANPGWPKSLTIATSSPGGIYLPYGRFLAKLWNQKFGIPVDAVVTQGSQHNVKLLALGGAQIGMTTMGIALQGWNGTGEWTAGKRYQNIRALFPMYDTPFQVAVLRRSGITALQQLDHKVVGIGPRAGTGGIYIPDIMKLLGVAPEIRYGSIDDQATELLAGRYTASAALTGAPVPAFSRAEDKEPLTFIRLTPEQIDAVQKAFPEMSASTIPIKTYKSLTADYATFGVYNFAIGRADLPADLVYQMVKAVFENTPALAREVSPAADTLPHNVVKDTFLPLHPGAIRYYREIGIQIEPKLIPAT